MHGRSGSEIIEDPAAVGGDPDVATLSDEELERAAEEGKAAGTTSG